MLADFRYSYVFIACVLVSSFCVITSQGSAAEPITCYQGSIESNNKGSIQLSSEQQLSIVPCSTQTSTIAPTTKPLTTTTAAAVVPVTSAQPQPSSKPPATTQPVSPTGSGSGSSSGSSSRRRRDASGYTCSILKSFPNGSKLTTNTTWTANFSCVHIDECQKNVPVPMFCCNTSNCNSLPYFLQVSGTPIASVGKCLGGYTNGSESHIFVQNCEGRFCFNRTLNGQTTFGCSKGRIEASCANITRGEAGHKCTKDGTLCCCSSENCNGIPPVPPIIPSHRVPTTKPYMVTASRTSSHWTLVLLITVGILIGVLVGILAVVLCKRWKRKRVNGPLNISYSRVSADCAYEDDDNIFSY